MLVTRERRRGNRRPRLRVGFTPYPALFCPLSVHLLDQYIVPLLNRATKLPYHSPCGVPNAVMLFTVVDIATGLLCPG
jgi:hypothetical protein